MLELLEMARQYRRKNLTSLKELEDMNCRALISEVTCFLWRVCLREAGDFNLAYSAADLAFNALIAEETGRNESDRFCLWSEGSPRKNISPRLWLFFKARQFVRKLRSDTDKRTSSEIPRVLRGLAQELSQPPLKFEALVAKRRPKNCQLQKSVKRGPTRLADCWGGCDTIFFYREKFTVREIAHGLDLTRSTVQDHRDKCLKFYSDLRDHSEKDV